MADEQKVMNRWLVVVGAILIQLALGAIYAWSVFTPGLTRTAPKDIALLYRAEMLQVEAAAYAEMKKELSEPGDELKTVLNKLKVATTEAEIKELERDEAAIIDTMNQIALKYVDAKTIDSLTYGFSTTRSQAIFSAGLALFAIVMVLAGRMMPKLGPRTVAMAGGLVLGLGYMLAGLIGGKSFAMHLICIGIIGGSGIGLAYVVPIAVAMRWFPDKKGMITGLAVAGFGFGATLWVKLAGAWGALIATQGLPKTFLIYGLVFLAMVVIGGIWMKFPPEGWLPAGYTPPEPKSKDGKAAAGSVDLQSGQMLATPQYYMILLTFIFGAGAGLMSIGLMKAWPIQALTMSGMDLAKASATAGTAMAIFFSLANGIGRIAWGTISDKLGRKKSIIIMMAVQGVMVIAFQKLAGNTGMLYLGATLIGFNFGGNFALFPTITADTFGAKYVGQNYGWVFLAYGIGGILGPIMGGKLGDLGNFPLAFTISGALCLLAAVIAALIKPVETPAGVASAAPEAEAENDDAADDNSGDAADDGGDGGDGE